MRAFRAASGLGAHRPRLLRGLLRLDEYPGGQPPMQAGSREYRRLQLPGSHFRLYRENCVAALREVGGLRWSIMPNAELYFTAQPSRQAGRPMSNNKRKCAMADHGLAAQQLRSSEALLSSHLATIAVWI